MFFCTLKIIPRQASEETEDTRQGFFIPEQDFQDVDQWEKL